MSTLQTHKWNLEACINTIKLYHPVCECPSDEECAAAGDMWMCESCLCDEAQLELSAMVKELQT